MAVSPLNFGHGGIVHAFTATSLWILCLGLTKWGRRDPQEKNGKRRIGIQNGRRRFHVKSYVLQI
ncbi:hypothetical protein GBA52_020632 [Prunus armeniaca]|nr:hypothetical protein GBA52_020632 [Prunus armeniaca]